MKEFIHCIDLSDQLKNFNFCSRRAIESLLAIQLILEDAKPNPMNMDIDVLINCPQEILNGVVSAKMTALYKASKLKKLKRKLTPSENHTIKIAELEIEFEKGRRIYNYSAPSRLSCLYLAEDDLDSREMLRGMFVNVFSRPKIINVEILNQMEIVQVDHKWVNKYFEEPNKDYIKKYWTGIAYNEDFPSWEYLLEGTIIMKDKIQILEMDDRIKSEYPQIFNQIMEERQKLDIN